MVIRHNKHQEKTDMEAKSAENHGFSFSYSDPLSLITFPDSSHWRTNRSNDDSFPKKAEITKKKN